MSKWSVDGRSARVALLVVTEVPDGADVRVSCKGHGCAFRHASPKVTGGRAALTELFRNRALRRGAVIRIAVTRPGATAWRLRLVVP